MLRLRTKLILGLTFLFAVTLAISMQGIYRIYQLDRDARLILQQNLHSIVYCNNMLQALETRPVQLAVLQEQLALQQHNVTEHGEEALTSRAATLIQQLAADPANTSLTADLRHIILQIAVINQDAITRKSNVASVTASRAILGLSVFTLIALCIYLIFFFMFPQIISRPIDLLTAGIREMADSNYSTRIALQPDDELGEAAAGINSMADQLKAYEQAPVARLRADKATMETIVNLIPEGVIALDEKRNVLFMNTVAKRICGPVKVSGNAMLEAILQQSPQQPLDIKSGDGPHTFEKKMVETTDNPEGIHELIMLRPVG